MALGQGEEGTQNNRVIASDLVIEIARNAKTGKDRRNF
jgi:hypothetical protein